jgi:3'(2'), 5'-bisphosphate nucleotidase
MKIELETVKELAVRAGGILLEHYADPTSVEWKGKNDPVTAADRAASRFVVDELRKRFPQDGILCEEEKDDLQRLTQSRVWIIDPMDGTKEFISRNGEFSVMIGLAVDGEARLGAIYQPTQKKLYYAGPGTGTFLTHDNVTRQLRVSGETNLSKAVIAISRSHLSPAIATVQNDLGIEQTIQTGSIGLKVGLLCEGKADIYVQGKGTSLWDTCGPEAILREAGGRMTNKNGGRFAYNIEEVRNLQGVVATNAVFHDRVLQAAAPVL